MAALGGHIEGSQAVPDRRIWLDGELVPWHAATVHVLSHSLQRGSLVFDYMSVKDTHRGPAIFRLDDHVTRLLRSAELVGLPLERSAEELTAAIVSTVRANPGSTAVKISAFLPSIEIDVVPVDDLVSVAIAAYHPGRDIAAYKPSRVDRRDVLRIWVEKCVRNRRSDIVPPQAKVAANYVSPMLAKWRARKNGYDEILLVDEEGYVAEGPTTNVFIVGSDGALQTPSTENVLPGVTRSTILEIARRDGLTVRETQVRPEELMAAREVFLTGTTAGVWPVVSVDDQAIGDGSPGITSQQLRSRFQEVVSGADSEFLHWLTFVNPA
ncbi:aminotransferase class IV [Myxococcota bacterium]|nr:aminotransferase class IV [Myxococcota bacterium]